MNTSSQVDYDSIIVDCTAELREFRGVVCELNMPVINVGDLLAHILPSIVNQQYFERSIAIATEDMGEAEGVCTGLLETEEDYLGPTDTCVSQAAIQLGRAVKNKLESYNAYRAGVFAYDLKEYVNDATVVFTKRSLSGA